MTWSALRLPVISAIALVVAFAGCRSGGGSAKQYDDVRKGAALLPRDIALEFLQGIRSRPGRSVLGGESVIPPCELTSSGVTSRGEYKKVTGYKAPNEVNRYNTWILFRIEDASGRDFRPAELDKPNAWNYSLRMPKTAKTVLGTQDRCILGPSTEPLRKVLEALAALNIEIAPEFAYILPKR
jgi:hypothetical protein